MKLRVLAVSVASIAVAAALPAAPIVAHAAASQPLQQWSDTESRAGNYNNFLYGGVAAGDLQGNGQEDIVVGYPDGVVKVFNSADGTVLWALQTDGQIASTPTLADLYNNGQEEVIVTTMGGSVYVWSPTGQLEPGWPQHTQDGSANHTGFPDTFVAGVAVGQIFGNGVNYLVTEGWDHYLYVWNAFGGEPSGFPINLADTAWTTPALVPSVAHPGQEDIIAGADSDGGLEPYSKGGEYFRFSNTGCPEVNYLIDNSNNLGQKNLHGAAACQVGNGWPEQISNTAWSSATVFDTGGGNWATVLGAGAFFGQGEPCSVTIDPADCGRSFRLINPGGGTPQWVHAASDGQVETTAAVGNIKPGDDGHDIAITDNGLEPGGSCLYAVNSAGANIFAPICNQVVQMSQPVIGPIDSSGDPGIWIGDGSDLVAYNSSGTQTTSLQFGDNTGYLPGAPVLFNNGGGVEVAAMGANTRAGGSYNQWQLSVYSVDPGGTVGPNAFPRYHFDNNNDGQVQDSVATSVPYNVTAVAGDTQATVNWHAPVDVGSGTPIQYDVNVYDKNNNYVKTQSDSTPFMTITGLTNGEPYYFRVRTDNPSPSDWSDQTYSVTPYPAATPQTATNNTTFSTNQYRLPNSDGSTWQDVDPTNLAFSFTATSTNEMFTGNADLWTSNSGYNQDIGICVVTGTTNCNSSPSDIIAWKESGGSAGTFSPNAAAVQGVATGLSPGTSYNVVLVWKSNKPAKGASIWAAAGPGNAHSPTRLSARTLDFLSAISSAQQLHLDTSDGSTWVQMAPSGLSTTFTTEPSATLAVLTANADLWTATAGYNQDIGILVQSSSDGAYGSAGKVVAWKESGGYAGTFSPNAAYVSTAITVQSATQYTATLVWKSNKPMGLPTNHGIYFGAGSTGNFSPTTLVAMQPTSFVGTHIVAYPIYPQVNKQYSMTGNQDVWTPLDDTHYDIVLSPPSGSCLTVISMNADLWTANAGFNQDIGFLVNGGDTPVAWKESGGFAGTFSPNAAYVEYEYTAIAGDTVRVVWKSNIAGGATIEAAAGNSPNFSPSTLLVQYLC